MLSNSTRLVFLISISLFLTACGGGDSTATNANETETPISSIQPTAVSANNWSSARLIQTTNSSQSNVEIVGSELIINIQSVDISQGAHLQIYINTDNKPETGYQFDNEAWEESGVDYLIEDGDLFKSTENNSGWNWNVNIGAIDYTLNNDMANAKIDLSLLGDICSTLKLGIMTRDEFWDISTFSPASSQMQTFEVSYCNSETLDTVNPELTLLGANPLNLNINDTFIDPGVTATDNIDGDITNRVHLKSTVDTAIAGTYEVTYVVTDIAGNSAHISRTVIVNDVSLPDGIAVDGNSNDWINIPSFSSSADAIMKVSDDEEKLYILVTSSNLGENIQILMDTDNNASTGLNLSSQVTAWIAGADYMIENNSLDKSKSNSLWSWEYGTAPIEYIKTGDTLEIAIKKTDFNFVANKVPMGFVSRTEDWNVNYILPAQELPIYDMQFTNEVNPVVANNDSVTTANNKTKIIDVIANDISLTNSALKVFEILTQPSSGSAKIEQNKIRYSPNTTFTGTVTFSYDVRDSLGNGDVANIKVIVTEPVVVNTAPVAKNDASTTEFNTTVSIQVLNNDSDADGDTLAITSISVPANGKAIKVGNKINYTPNTGFFGTDAFNYSISDGNGGSANAKVTITVNDRDYPAPVAKNDISSTLQNQSITIDALANDNGAEISIIKTSNPVNGSAEIINNKVKYTPVNQFIGTEVFTYTIGNAQGGVDTANITVNVTALPNIAPVANNDSATTNGIKTKQVSVLTNDTDADGDSLQIIGFTQPANGTISLTTATATFNYTPNATFSGVDTFTYKISDGNEGTDEATVTMTVPTNNFPDAVEDVADVFFNATKTINVLSNDTDPDGDILSIESIVQPPVGFARLNDNGTIFFDPQNNVGSISIIYTVSDSRGGTDIAVLTVSSTDPNDGNDAFPDISNEQVSTPKNIAVFIDVLANDSDADGDVLVLDQVDQGQNGTTEKVTRNGVLGVLYTPNPGFTGTDLFYYGVHDGFGHNGAGFVEMTVTQ